MMKLLLVACLLCGCHVTVSLRKDAPHAECKCSNTAPPLPPSPTRP